MFCVQCGKELPEDAMVCPDCGAKVEKEINFSNVTDYAGKKAQQVSENIQSQVQNFRQAQAESAESRKIKDVSELFVNAEEQQRAVIGGGYLRNMLNAGVLGKGFGVLTDRRLYYRGKCFYKMGGRYMKTDEDCVIDLQKISSTGFTYTRYLWLLLLSIISLAVGVFVSMDWGNLAPFSYAFCFFIVFVIPYILLKKSVYTVTYAGGSLSIKASAYGVSQVRDFDKELHLAKDEFVSQARYQG